MKNITKQRGASMLNILMTLALAVFLAFTGIKIGAFYIDNNVVKKGLNELDDVPFVTKKSAREIQDILRTKYSMNNLNIDYKNEIKVDKRSDRLVVDVNYERRVHVVSNIDVVVTFENHYEAVNR